MHIRSIFTLFSITLLLLNSACTPQLVKNEETPSAASSGDDNSAFGQESKAAESSVPDTRAPSPKRTPENSQNSSTATTYKPGSAEITAKPQSGSKPLAKSPATPKTKPTRKPQAKPRPEVAAKPTVKPKPKAVEKPEAKPGDSSGPAGALVLKEETAQQKKTVEEPLLEAKNEPVRPNDPTPDSPEKASPAVDPELVPDATMAEEDSVIAETPEAMGEKDDLIEAPRESMNDTQQLAILTEKSAITEQAPAVAEDKALDMAALPLYFGTDWSLDRRPTPISDQAQCLLASRSVNISDGYDRTNVQMLLTAHSLYVKTDSNIDLSYPGTGVRLDDGSLLPFEGLAKETTAIISSDVAMLYQRMVPSRTAIVRLGFWPTWPVTETQEASFPLSELDDAVKALWLCEKM